MGLQLTGKKSIWDTLGNIGQGVVQGAADVVGGAGNALNLGIANATNNQQAANNARAALNNSASAAGRAFTGNGNGNGHQLLTDINQGVVSPIARPAVGTVLGAAQDLYNPIANHFNLPNAGNTNDVFGDTVLKGLANYARNGNKNVDLGRWQTLTGNAINTGLNVAGALVGEPEAGGIVDQAATRIGGKLLADVAPKIVRAGTNAALGGAGAAANDYTQTGKVNLDDVRKGALASVASGEGIRAGIKTGKYVIDNAKPLNEQGFIKVPGATNANPPQPHEAFTAEYADALKSMDDGAKGGQMQPTGDGGYIRTTEHSPFYSNYYAENGRAPSQTAYYQEAQRQLESGHADSYAQSIYNDLKNPETRSLLTQQGNEPLSEADQNELSAQQLAQDASAQPKPVYATHKPIPQTSAEDMGKALGMSDEEIAKAKAGESDNPDVPNLADLSPKDQMAVFQQNETPLHTPEENTAANPYKSPITAAAPGEYDKVIANSQLVKRGVDLAKSQTLNAFDKLTDEQKGNFMRYLEHPDQVTDPKLAEALTRFSEGTDMVHGHSQALGGNTNYIQNYALHSWDLPEGMTEQAVNGGGKDFQGLNNISRKHATIEAGEAAGLKLNDDPAAVRQQIEDYFNASGNALRKQALRKGIAEADAGAEKTNKNFTLGPGESMAVSEDAAKALRGVNYHEKSNNAVVKGYRKVNRGLTSTLLTHTGVHEMNITMRAAPGLALKGHGISALKATVGGIRGNFDKGYVDRIKSTAVSDGTADKAAQIGAPYSSGHGLLDRQLTPIHDQVVRSVISDLEKKNIPLDSAEARSAGKAAANMMGEVNYELAHVSKSVENLLGDTFLAKQFTPSKFMRVKQALTERGTGGNYARATLIGNTLATTALLVGVSSAMKQKSDNTKDILLRALVAPSAPTGMKDSKGNNVQLKFLGTDTSDVAKILGITLNRGKDGHLGLQWNPHNMPSTSADYLRSRLSPVLGDVLKVATNQNYAGKPIYDPNSSVGDKAAQIATALTINSLPIAAQTLAYTKQVKNLAPNSVKEVLDANTPKTNTAVNAALGTVGFSENTDTTTGKGLQTKQYYDALAKAGSGLDAQEKDAFNLITGSKKNPVTGKYDTAPTVYDSSTKASLMLQNPKVLANITAMNKQLAANGQKTDPFYTSLSPDQQKAYLQYQRMPLGSADRTNWQNNNKWLDGFEQARNAFFNSLPQGDPNRPQLPIQPPKETDQITNEFNAYNAETDPTKQVDYINAHPDLQNYLDQYAQYTNQMRNAQGYASLRSYPKADAATESFINSYMAADKATKSAMRSSNPAGYTAMQSYMAQATRYGLDKAAGLDELVNPGQDQNAQPDQKYLKDVYNMGNYDIAKTAMPNNQGSSYSLDPNSQNTASNAAYNSYKSYNATASANRKARGFMKESAYLAKKGPQVMTYSQNRTAAKHITAGIKKPSKGRLRIATVKSKV